MRWLGQIFPILILVVGAYFLLIAMTTDSTVTRWIVVPADAKWDGELEVIRKEQRRGDADAPYDAEVLVGTTATPGLSAVASALCFGSVLLWSRLGTAAPAQRATEAP